VCEAIREEVPSNHEDNIAAAREAHDKVAFSATAVAENV